MACRARNPFPQRRRRDVAVRADVWQIAQIERSPLLPSGPPYPGEQPALDFTITVCYKERYISHGEDPTMYEPAPTSPHAAQACCDLAAPEAAIFPGPGRMVGSRAAEAAADHCSQVIGTPAKLPPRRRRGIGSPAVAVFHAGLRWNETGRGWNKSPGIRNTAAGKWNEKRAAWNVLGTRHVRAPSGERPRSPPNGNAIRPEAEGRRIRRYANCGH